MLEHLTGKVAGKGIDLPRALVLPQTIRKLWDGGVLQSLSGFHLQLGQSIMFRLFLLLSEVHCLWVLRDWSDSWVLGLGSRS